jgi:hypothetical protein
MFFLVIITLERAHGVVAYISTYKYYTIPSYINNSTYISIYRTPMTSGEKTKVTLARPGSNSLRATIPRGIVSHFSIKQGDTLNWTIEPKNGALKIVVNLIKS